MVMLATSQGLRTCASEKAARNFKLNRAALGRTQPGLAGVMGEAAPEVEYLFGRDGTLTAMDGLGVWVGGCSVPGLAAREMLKSMQLTGRTGCLLDPSHAAQIRAALDGIGRMQAMVVLLSDPAGLPLMLACEDFSGEILAHRLWFCCGGEMSGAIEELFTQNPGLTTPSHFIRTVLLADEPGQILIRDAEGAFSRINSRRQEQLRAISSQPAGATSSWCIIAPMAFRLWNDAGWTLAKVFDDSDAGEVILFDPDDPAAASPLALARASADAGAMVAPNLVRSDMPGLYPIDRPWVTWITGPRVGSFTAGAGRDAVLLADERWRSAALAAGWPADRIHLAAWPMMHTLTGGEPPAESHLVLVADTTDLKPPPAVCELSSQRLLWEQIVRELHEDPFRLGDEPLHYLRRRMRRAGIAEETLNSAVFVDELLIPAYQQGIARILLRGQFPVRVFGRGWDGQGEFAACWGGEIADREHFHEVVLDRRSVLIHPMPMGTAHPMDGLPGRRLGVQKSAAALLREASAGLQGRSAVQAIGHRMLSREMIQSLPA